MQKGGLYGFTPDELKKWSTWAVVKAAENRAKLLAAAKGNDPQDRPRRRLRRTIRTVPGAGTYHNSHRSPLETRMPQMHVQDRKAMERRSLGTAESADSNSAGGAYAPTTKLGENSRSGYKRNDESLHVVYGA